jgi:AhpC/TSA family
MPLGDAFPDRNQSTMISNRFASLLIGILACGFVADRAAAAEPVKTHPPGEVASANSNATRPEVPDLDGRLTNPWGDPKAKLVVLIFVSTDCPVANRYAPEIERLFEAYARRNVDFWLVYADGRDSVAKIRGHLRDYQYKLAALRDPEHRLVKRCQVQKTPEAAVFAADGKEVYRGRIDDRFTDYGKSRRAPSHRDLQEAIDAVLSGRPVKVAKTDVVGCFIPDPDP